MVRAAEKRKRKYERNLQPTNIGRAFAAQKGIMLDQEKTYFPQISLIEMKTKKICEAQGIPTYEIAQYLNYARELYSKGKRFSQGTLANEAQYLLNKWESRGLLGSKLVEIAKLFGVTPTAPAAAPTWLPIIHKMRLNHYYHTILACRSLTSLTELWKEAIQGQLFPLTRAATFDRICAYNRSVGPANARLKVALYYTDENVYPTDLIVESGQLDFSTDGLKCSNIDISLDAETYFLAWMANIDTPAGQSELSYSPYALMMLGSDDGRLAYSGWGHTWLGWPNFPDPFPTTAPWFDWWIYSISLRFTGWA